MKVTHQHPTRGDWNVLTETSAPRLRGPTGDGCGYIFECYGIAKNGDRIEYRITLSGNELRAMSKALGTGSEAPSVEMYRRANRAQLASQEIDGVIMLVDGADALTANQLRCIERSARHAVELLADIQ